MKIAVVGGGISGMLVARMLADDHDVHVFEAEGYVGGHTHTVDVEVDGGTYAADTGFVVFNDRTYPNSIRMLDLLGVPSRDSDMSFSVRLNCPVDRVERHEDHVLVTPRGDTSEVFDRVVLAAHADQSLAMLVDPSPAEQEILGAIPYQANDVVLHTDTHLLPRTRRAWASWNCHIADSEQPSVTLTYNLNQLQGHRPSTPILETINPTMAVDPAKVLGRMTYHHPVYSVQALDAQGRYSEINGQRGTYYCGAYWGYGFHEDEVRSALAVADCFGKSLETCIAAST